MDLELIYLLVGLLIGVVFTWLIAAFRYAAKPGVRTEELKKNYVVKELFDDMDDRLNQLQKEVGLKEEELLELNRLLAAREQTIDNYREKLQTQLQEVNRLQERFKVEFENIANRLLEEKSLRFAQQNQTNIDQILKPLQDKIQHFEQKIENAHVEESKQRAGLAEQIRSLSELNQQMSSDAKSLTKALKGDSKTQGNWGELILERILEKSGLRKGTEYVIQQNLKDEYGQRFQPDVVIHLPDNRHLIIDSKMSLTAYESYASLDDEVEKADRLKRHILSVRTHLMQLSAKNYQNLYGIESLDFVLMFVPLEPAFALAVQHDEELFYDAFDANIVMVSPTTLLATARTIANLWRQEHQNRNAREIARQGGALYDKFVNFILELELVGDRLKSTQKAYDGAMKKLDKGKGSLVRRTQILKELGARTAKNLPAKYLEKDSNDQMN